MTTAPVKTVLTRAGAALIASAAMLGMLSACTPAEPEPTPTKTALFASEDEAFAAAEETYRAYNDALNEDRNGVGTENPKDYLIGQAYEGSVDGERQVNDAGLKLEGDVLVTEFIAGPEMPDGAQPQVRATVCLDLSDTRVVDLDSGEEADVPDRPKLVAQEIEMTWVKDSFLISEESEGDVALCASS